MRPIVLFALAVLVASTAAAQTSPTTGGPMVFERINEGWVVAPDFKVTDIDSRTGQLAGAYGGRLIDSTLLIGAAGYWLANQERDFKMGYGGLLVGWQSRELGRVRFGGRGLVGAGTATLGLQVTPFPTGQRVGGMAPGGDIRFGVTVPGSRDGASARAFAPQTRRLVGRDDFLVFEPQATVSARLLGSIGISCGLGYRTTAETDLLRDRLNGPTANLAVQFGW